MQRVKLQDVDLRSLRASVGPARFALGTEFVSRRAVLQMVWVSSQHALCGVVRGLDGENATPAVYFKQEALLRVERTQCSCRQRTGCAHAVALVIAATEPEAEQEHRPDDARAALRAERWARAEAEAIAEVRARQAGQVREAEVRQRRQAGQAREAWQTHAPGQAHAAGQAREAGRAHAAGQGLDARLAREPKHETLEAEHARGKPDRWAASLEVLLGDASKKSIGHTPLGIELTLSPDAGKGFRLAARLVLPGKNGGWVGGSLSWSKLDAQSFYGHYRADHVRLLREMNALYRFGTNQPYYFSPGEERTINLSAFASHRLWPLLDEAAAEGIALIKAGTGEPVQRHAKAELCLDVTRENEDLLIKPAVNDAGAVPVTFIGPDGHGVVCADRADIEAGKAPATWRFWLAKLASPAPPPLQELALADRSLRIPVCEQARLRDEFYPRLRRLASVISSDGAFEPPVISPPTLVLRADYGERHRLDVSWAWAYRVGDATHRVKLTDADQAGFRDFSAERELLALLPDRILTQDARFDGIDTMRFSTEVLPLLDGLAGVLVEVTGEPADYREESDSLEIGVSTERIPDDNDWFDLGITITVAGRPVAFGDMFVALSRGETHLLLPDGAFISLEKPELEALRRLIDEARALTDADGPLKISRFQAGLWEELAALGVVSRQARAWQEQVQGLLDIDEIAPQPPPAGLTATLRPYQLDGFGWLAFLWEHNLGGILADDMGLGKTLQALALIAHARSRRPGDPPFLIVAPTSVVPNWAAEASRFTPGMKVVPITDTVAKRGVDLAELCLGADAVVTSYTLLRLDFDRYAVQRWSGMILDEAQYVKNHQSKVYQCARRLTAPFKVAISGTPLENNLMELWSLLSVTAPGLFVSPVRFKEYYQRPIERLGDRERLAQFRRRIRPLLKRRTKEQVAADLPAKQEQVLTVQLHPRHRKVYQTHLQRERSKVLGLIDDVDKNRFTILRSLTVLRQLSLHAGLVDSDNDELPSAKIDALLEQVADVAAGGHRALVFSQFTSFLRLVRLRLEAAGVQCCYLDGSTTDRATVISEFKQGSAPVFLISLKAGGFGLNLTEADYCFLLDPWWNPATEAQAIDRTHRIGQTRNVLVYRLIAADTIEEKVLALQARKAELFANVMDGGNAFGGGLSADDIRGLFA